MSESKLLSVSEVITSEVWQEFFRSPHSCVSFSNRSRKEKNTQSAFKSFIISPFFQQNIRLTRNNELTSFRHMTFIKPFPPGPVNISLEGLRNVSQFQPQRFHLGFLSFVPPLLTCLLTHPSGFLLSFHTGTERSEPSVE